METKQIKKVGILTQPLHNNYGGLLQAYALQKTIKNLGYDVWIINRDHNKRGLIKRLKTHTELFINKYVLNKKNTLIRYPSKKEKLLIGKNTIYFKNKYITPITPVIDSNAGMHLLNEANFDAYVVGSDQVWRPKYSPNIKNFFLDFVDGTKKVSKVAYAASFGVSDWEFNRQETSRCSGLVKDFNAVSVRETSGIPLCDQYLGVKAIQVLDPTLLLEPNDYSLLIQNENEPQLEGSLMTYVLDRNYEKEKFIETIAQKLNLKLSNEMQFQPLTIENRNDIEKCIYPTVTKWLMGLRDAEFVITDSFHGCAFSILFNKPFLVLGNERRGLTRFESVLNLFNLKERLITDTENLKEDQISSVIYWDKINALLATEREKSLKFLQDKLPSLSFALVKSPPVIINSNS